VWDVEEQTSVKVLTGFPRSNDVSTSKIRCHIAWDKAGKVCLLNVFFDKHVPSDILHS